MALPVLAVDQVYEVAYRARSLRTLCEVINVAHCYVFTQTASPTNTIADLANEASDTWINNIVPVLSDDYFLINTTVKEITDVTATPNPSRPLTVTTYGTMYVDYTTAQGGVASPSLPAFVTVSARNQTADPRRYFRGGLHLGPIATSQQHATNKDLLSAAAETAWNVALTDWNDDMILADLTVVRWCILSKVYLAYEIPAHANVQVGTKDIIQSTVNQWFRSQLSREAPHVP